MEWNIERYKTDYKLGKPVLKASGIEGTYNKMAVDSPFVFWHNNQYYMLHVGFDGIGYQTALSVSDDLLHWSEGKVLFPRKEEEGWDRVGVAGVWILKNNNLKEKPTLKKYNGRYWMVYHSYPNEGYEAGSAQIGLAWTEDEELLKWNKLEKPILSWKDGALWEQGGLYKGCMLEHNNKFYLFYNAKQRDLWPWNEQIGMAVSDDLFHWERAEHNPVIRNSENDWDLRFDADPYVVKDGDNWIMFYYGFNGEKAAEGIAFSKDLYHWEKYPKPILTPGVEGAIDHFFAHKPSVLQDRGRLYHFYCAVRESRKEDHMENVSTIQGKLSEFRCISVASDKPF